MTLTKEEVDSLALKVFDGGMVNLGSELNEKVISTGWPELPSELINILNEPEDVIPQGWTEFVKWVWHQIKRLAKWLHDKLK